MPSSFVSQSAIRGRSACPIRHAVAWLTPTASARRTLEMPLSDWSCIQSAVSRVRIGSFVACSGVPVVAVNCRRQPQHR
jgi:hypothetical protein